MSILDTNPLFPQTPSLFPGTPASSPFPAPSLPVHQGEYHGGLAQRRQIMQAREQANEKDALVFGATLKCPYGSQTTNLLVFRDIKQINGCELANITDCIVDLNIFPFGDCMKCGTCDGNRLLDWKWTNIEPQFESINGKEIITMSNSKLFCFQLDQGEFIIATDTGQDGIAAGLIKFMLSHPQYKDLIAVLLNPYDSVYLHPGPPPMYQTALQFLQDIGAERKLNGAGPFDMNNSLQKTHPEDFFMGLAINNLLMGNMGKDSEFKKVQDAINEMLGANNGVDLHNLTPDVLDALEKYCAGLQDQVGDGDALRKKLNYDNNVGSPLDYLVPMLEDLVTFGALYGLGGVVFDGLAEAFATAEGEAITAGEALEAAAAAKNTEELSAILSKYNISSVDEVWSLPPTLRGQAMEEILANTEYRDWFNCGQLDNGKFPIIDYQKGTEVVSLKTIDPTLPSYQNGGADAAIRGYINDLNEDIKVDGVSANKTLDVRIPPGTSGSLDIDALTKYAEKNGITLIITEG